MDEIAAYKSKLHEALKKEMAAPISCRSVSNCTMLMDAICAADKLSDKERAAFDAVDLGKGVLSQAELLAHRLPEMPANLVPIIEDIWLTDVVGRYNN